MGAQPLERRATYDLVEFIWVTVVVGLIVAGIYLANIYLIPEHVERM